MYCVSFIRQLRQKKKQKHTPGHSYTCRYSAQGQLFNVWQKIFFHLTTYFMITFNKSMFTCNFSSGMKNPKQTNKHVYVTWQHKLHVVACQHNFFVVDINNFHVDNFSYIYNGSKTCHYRNINTMSVSAFFLNNIINIFYHFLSPCHLRIKSVIDWIVNCPMASGM